MQAIEDQVAPPPWADVGPRVDSASALRMAAQLGHHRADGVFRNKNSNHNFKYITYFPPMIRYVRCETIF